MLSGPSFRSAFVFSINSLILSGFHLTFFQLAEASLSAFSWLYTHVCAVAEKYRGGMVSSLFMRSKKKKEKQREKRKGFKAEPI